jgi:hypothetical protein
MCAARRAAGHPVRSSPALPGCLAAGLARRRSRYPAGLHRPRSRARHRRPGFRLLLRRCAGGCRMMRSGRRPRGLSQRAGAGAGMRPDFCCGPRRSATWANCRSWRARTRRSRHPLAYEGGVPAAERHERCLLCLSAADLGAALPPSLPLRVVAAPAAGLAGRRFVHAAGPPPAPAAQPRPAPFVRLTLSELLTGTDLFRAGGVPLPDRSDWSSTHGFSTPRRALRGPCCGLSRRRLRGIRCRPETTPRPASRAA